MYIIYIIYFIKFLKKLFYIYMFTNLLFIYQIIILAIAPYVAKEMS